MNKEALVFGRDERVNDMLWEIIVSNQNSPTLANLGDQVAIAAEYT